MTGAVLVIPVPVLAEVVDELDEDVEEDADEDEDVEEDADKDDVVDDEEDEAVDEDVAPPAPPEPSVSSQPTRGDARMARTTRLDAVRHKVMPPGQSNARTKRGNSFDAVG